MLYIDALTGAYNRRYYEDKLRKKELEAGIAMMDLDDFKLANDTFGHEIGDLFLITVVRVIKSVIRKTDALIRFGGDEFLLVMPEIAEEVFEGKLKEIRRQFGVQDSGNRRIRAVRQYRCSYGKKAEDRRGCKTGRPDDVSGENPEKYHLNRMEASGATGSI